MKCTQELIPTKTVDKRGLSSVGVTHRRVAREVNIMKKLGTHKNVLQLLDWNITQGKRHMLVY